MEQASTSANLKLEESRTGHLESNFRIRLLNWPNLARISQGRCYSAYGSGVKRDRVGQHGNRVHPTQGFAKVPTGTFPHVYLGYQFRPGLCSQQYVQNRKVNAQGGEHSTGEWREESPILRWTSVYIVLMKMEYQDETVLSPPGSLYGPGITTYPSWRDPR